MPQSILFGSERVNPTTSGSDVELVPQRESGRPVTYVHIGSPKSGTTYLQRALWNNREALRDRGVLYPGEVFRSHTHAVLDLQRRRFFGHQDPAIPGAWQRTVEEIRAWNGTAIISQELLSPAGPDAIERALASLAFSEVHLIFTARDLARQVPAAWQEDVKNRYDLGFEEFVASLRAPEEEMHPQAAGFWRMQDAAGVLARWGRDVPPEHVHLVTIPQGNVPQRTLWIRFCAVTGLDADAYTLPGDRANVSLGLNEASLLRRLNTALGEEVRWPLYNECVTGLLGVDTLAGRPRSQKIVLPAGARAWITEQAHQMIEALRKERYEIVGDLNDLVPEALAVPRDEPTGEDEPFEQPADSAMLDAAVDSMAALLGRLQAWRDDLDHLSVERDALRADIGGLRADIGGLRTELDLVRADRDRLQAEGEELREVLAKSATKLFVRRLSEEHRSVMRLRIIYWNIVEAGRRLRRGVRG
jgi:hypothetical protein